MEHSGIQLNDLPDEILMIIFKKLRNLAVLYSFIDVNKRLNKIVHDSIFTNSLTLLNKATNGFIYPLSNPILDRFCLHILPKIHDKIKWLNLESSSMKRILLATNYPNLHGLGLYNIEEAKTVQLFIDETLLSDILKKQISSLMIHIIGDTQHNSSKDFCPLIFTQIFTMFTNLELLYFDVPFTTYDQLPFDISCPTVFSSTLIELHVKLSFYDDCLYFLDGRFNQLHTFHVEIYSSTPPVLPVVNNKEKLPNLKCFSMSQDLMMDVYDELILPLLNRMSNLEKLGLYLIVDRNKPFIDGNQLKTDIINNMSRLEKFSFNIRSVIPLRDQIDLPSNEDIQYTFKDFRNPIISCVNYFPDIEEGHCHIYSYPFTLKCYENIANNFPGGIFKCVREVSLYDERSFEHEFFLQIEKSFPFMNKLSVNNNKPQNNKKKQQSTIVNH